MEEVRILFVSANPNSTQKLDLADELRQFQASLRGHKVKLTLLPAAQPEDLQIAIKSRSFDVVHFSGHAKKKGILMRGPGGIEELVPVKDLQAMFSGTGVKLVVLNACNTSDIAEAIKGDVDTVIGTEKVVDERAAKLLSKVFYAGLSRGETIGTAYKEARDSIASRKEELDVYMAHGMEKAVALFPSQKDDELAVEVEGKEPFDRYYYVDYLDQQIDTFRTNRMANLVMLGVMLYAGFIFLTWAWHQDMATTLAATGQTAKDDVGIIDLLGWLGSELGVLLSESRGDTALLDWLVKVGPTIPTFLATMQARWCVHSSEKIRQLVAMKELVRNSENLTQDLRMRLHKILDQTLKGAETPSPISTVFGHLYRRTRYALEQAKLNLENR